MLSLAQRHLQQGTNGAPMTCWGFLTTYKLGVTRGREAWTTERSRVPGTVLQPFPRRRRTRLTEINAALGTGET